MRNNKGQALVEFVLVLPVLLFALLAFIDVASLFYSKYKLEDHLDQMVMLYEEGKIEEMKAYGESKNISFVIQENTTFVTIKIAMQQKMNTPILKNKLSQIETERTVYRYEEE